MIEPDLLWLFLCLFLCDCSNYSRGWSRVARNGGARLLLRLFSLLGENLIDLPVDLVDLVPFVLLSCGIGLPVSSAISVDP